MGLWINKLTEEYTYICTGNYFVNINESGELAAAAAAVPL